MERLQEALSRARERRAKAVAEGLPAAAADSAAPKKPVLRGGARNEEAIREAWAALPTLRINESHFAANRIVSYFGGKDASPMDMLRTKLVQQAKANGWRRIAITSPSPRCGKTTVSANLAFSLARQADLRTLLVETDLRRPALARTLGIAEPYSLARVLSGQENISDHMVRFGTNVAFATNHVSTSNPAELLHSARARAILAEIEATYAPDLILFDTAPLLSSDDTLGLMESVDAALLVAAAEVSTIEEIDVAERELAEVTQVIGVVLNKSRYASAGYGYDEAYY
ncbi:MAG: CpsD/CapB family tyrosine-protein kinase [Qingshengfaniella sp.]